MPSLKRPLAAVAAASTALLGLIATAPAARASVVTHTSGDTGATTQSFDRPDYLGEPFGRTVGHHDAFQVVTLDTRTSGTFTFAATGFDTVVCSYGNGFDPSAPSTALNQCGLGSLTLNLGIGLSKVVVTGFDDDDAAAWSLAVTSPGPVQLSDLDSTTATIPTSASGAYT